MNLRKSLTAMLAAAGLAAISGAASASDKDLPLGISWNGDAPGGTPPWVNVLLRDFWVEDPNNPCPFQGSAFEWICKTVEVQVTTSNGFYDDPGGSCCGVQGKGNLTASENLKSLWLNVNPRLDVKKLKIYWTGSPMPDGPPGANVFPAAGLKPTNVAVGADAFRAGASCSFDILIEWKGDKKLGQDADWSKLLFVYDNGNSDISADDFMVASSTCKKGAVDAFGVFMGVGHIQNTSGGEGSGWIKQR